MVHLHSIDYTLNTGPRSRSRGLLSHSLSHTKLSHPEPYNLPQISIHRPQLLFTSSIYTYQHPSLFYQPMHHTTFSTCRYIHHKVFLCAIFILSRPIHLLASIPCCLLYLAYLKKTTHLLTSPLVLGLQ